MEFSMMRFNALYFSNKKPILIYLVSIFSFLAPCFSQNKPKFSRDIHIPLNEIKIDDLSALQFQNIGDRPSISYVNKSTSSIVIHYLDNNNEEKFYFPLANRISDNSDNVGVFSKNVVVYDYNENELISCNLSTGESKQLMSLNDGISIMSIAEHPIIVTEKDVFASISYDNLPISTPAEIIEYYRQKPIIRLNYTDYSLLGEFPAKFKKGALFGIYESLISYNYRDELIINSYHYSDSIQIIPTQDQTKSYWINLCAPKKDSLIQVPSLKLGNTSYIKRHNIKSPMYYNTYYNSNKEVYTRIFYPGFKEEVEYFPDPWDLNYELLFFNKKGEYLNSYLVEGKKYYIMYFLTNKNYFFLLKKSKSNEIIVSEFSF